MAGCESLLAHRMTTALQAAALVIGPHGVFPEIRQTS